MRYDALRRSTPAQVQVQQAGALAGKRRGRQDRESPTPRDPNQTPRLWANFQVCGSFQRGDAELAGWNATGVDGIERGVLLEPSLIESAGRWLRGSVDQIGGGTRISMPELPKAEEYQKVGM